MIVGVRIYELGRISYYNTNGIEVKKGDKVVVLYNNDSFLGTVELICSDKKTLMNCDNIVGLATDKDLSNYNKNKSEFDKAVIKCNSLIKTYDLDMHIIGGYYSLNREQLVFKFVADKRVDFRQLAKDLGSIYRTRIELRQVGIRDKARDVGGFGPCGRKLCCNNFLTEFDSVSINMAKNQNLSLNPSKINGVCGRLLCCLKYENDNYTEYKKDLPAIGKKIKTDNGTGKVISVDVFNRNYKIAYPDGNVEMVEVDNESKK